MFRDIKLGEDMSKLIRKINELEDILFKYQNGGTPTETYYKDPSDEKKFFEFYSTKCKLAKIHQKIKEMS